VNYSVNGDPEEARSVDKVDDLIVEEDGNAIPVREDTNVASVEEMLKKEATVDETIKSSGGLHKMFESELTQKDEEYNEMMNFINKDDKDTKFLRSRTTDPTSAMILIQGHWSLHLALWIVNLMTDPSRNNL